MVIGKQCYNLLALEGKINWSVDSTAVLFRSLLIITVLLPDVLVKKINVIKFNWFLRHFTITVFH